MQNMRVSLLHGKTLFSCQFYTYKYRLIEHISVLKSPMSTKLQEIVSPKERFFGPTCQFKTAVTQKRIIRGSSNFLNLLKIVQLLI